MTEVLQTKLQGEELARRTAARAAQQVKKIKNTMNVSNLIVF